jgi:hypothetical protein
MPYEPFKPGGKPVVPPTKEKTAHEKAKEAHERDPEHFAPPPDAPPKGAEAQEEEKQVTQEMLRESGDIAVENARTYKARVLAKKMPGIKEHILEDEQEEHKSKASKAK